MSWNHRVLASEEFHLNGEAEIIFSIHEVYYDDKGVPNGYTANPIRISGESMEGLKWTLEKMQECLEKPVLWEGERFPQVYEQ